MRKLALVVALSLLSLSSATHAAVVTWNFTAKVSEDYNSPLALNDTVSGSLSFETATAPSYYYDSDYTYYNMAVTAVSLDGFSLVPLTYSQISIRDNYRSPSCSFFCSRSDSFHIRTDLATTFPASPSVSERFDLGLGVSSGFSSPGDLNQIVNEDLPTNPYSLSSFPTRQIAFYHNTATGSFYFRADLTSLTLASAIPEPSTWAMMLLGFAGVGYIAFRRRNNAELLTV